MVQLMNKSMNFFKYYSAGEIIKSFLTSFLFFAIPASVIITTSVETIFLMIPLLWIIIVIMYILLIGTLSFSTKILIDTFRNYKVEDDFDYKLLYWLFFIVLTVMITIACLVVLFLFS